MATANMGKKAKKIEVAANVGIVIVALLVVVIFVQNYRAKSANQRATIPIGSKFMSKDINWKSNGRSMVFALSTTCHFCTESAPFYRELVKKCAEQHVHTVALFPQSTSEAAAYLRGEGVSVDEVRQMPLQSVRVSGTPTLVLVDAAGTVQSVWVGKLPAAEEKVVFDKLGS